jgi:cytochrome c biogenesis protein
MGSFYGFKGFVNILEGETVDRIFLRTKDQEIVKPISFSVRCDDFKITYYDIRRPEKLVKEYTSLLTILENGKEVLKKAVQVNHPLHYKGLAFYQSSYGVLHDVTLGIQRKDKREKSLLKTFEGETVPIPNSNTSLRVLKYAPQIHNLGEGVQVVVFKPNQEPRAFWVLKGSPEFGQPKNDEFILTFEGVVQGVYRASSDEGPRSLGGLDRMRSDGLRPYRLLLLFPSKGLGQNSKERGRRNFFGWIRQQEPVRV